MSKGKAAYRKLAEEQLDSAIRILADGHSGNAYRAELHAMIAAVYVELAKSDPVEAVQSM